MNYLIQNNTSHEFLTMTDAIEHKIKTNMQVINW